MSDLYMSHLYDGQDEEGENDPDNYDITDDLYVMAVDDDGVVLTDLFMVGAGTVAAHNERTIQGATRRTHADVALPLIDDTTDDTAVGEK